MNRSWLVIWHHRYDALFLCYLLCIATIGLVDSYKTPHHAFWLMLAVMALLLLMRLVRSNQARSKRPLSDRTPPYLTSAIATSVLPLGAAAYLLGIIISTLVGLTEGTPVLEVLLIPAIEIVLFLGITAFLVVSDPSFLKRVLLWGSVLIGLSALINLGLAATALSSVLLDGQPGYNRLLIVIGLHGHELPTTAGLTYSVFGVGAFATAIAMRRPYWQRFLLLTSSLILTIALLLTQARGSIGGACIAIAIAAWLKFGMIVRVASAGVLAMLLATALAVPSLRNAAFGRGDSDRLELWRIYLEKASERGLIGFGQVADTTVQISSGTVIEHPHNLVLSAQILGGPIAAASMLAILFGGVYWGYVYWRERGNPAPLAMIVVLLVAGTTDYALVISYPSWYWITFWFPIGILIGSEISVRAQRIGASSPAENSQ